MTDSHFPARKSVIVVVDDDPELVAILHMMLEENEFDLRCTYIGPQPLGGLEEQKPDLTF